MIAKIIIGNDLKGVLAYNVSKVDNGCAKVLSAPNCVTKSVVDNDFSSMRITDFALSFQSRLDANLRTEKPIVHIVLSLKENDTSDELLTSIASEYMEKMGYGDQPYVVVKHHDVENIHLHIVSIKVDEAGRKIDDRFEKRRSNAVRKELEEKYGLLKAEATNMSKSERYLRNVALLNEYVDKISFKPESVSYGDADLKKRIGTVLRYVQEYHNIDSMKAYNRVLAQFGVMCYEVDGVNSKGVPYKGVEYCVINGKGARISRGISGSSFGKRYTYKALCERFNQESCSSKDEKLLKDARKAIRYVLVNILKQWPSGISERDLNAELMKHGMSVQFFRNEEGRVFGVSFSDNVRKVTIKGSDIKFSINVMSKFLVDDRFSVSAREEYAVLREIRRIYNQARKEDFHYESDLINALPGLRKDWIGELSARGVEPFHAGVILDRFIRSRYGELSDILSKEQAYFVKQSLFALKEAQKLEERLRADYLYGFGIEVGLNGLYSVRNPKLRMDCTFACGSKSARARLFSKQERDLIRVIAEDRLSEIRFDMSGYLSLFKYLDEESLLKVRRKMTADAVDRILVGQDATNAKGLVERLLERGYIIHAVPKDGSWEYYVGDIAHKEECYVKVSDEMKSLLDKAGYESIYGSIRQTVMTRSGYTTAKYRLLVEIVRSMESENKVALERKLADLEKRNARLALSLQRMLAKNDLKGMLDLVRNYPSNSLSDGRKFKL